MQRINIYGIPNKALEMIESKILNRFSEMNGCYFLESMSLTRIFSPLKRNTWHNLVTSYSVHRVANQDGFRVKRELEPRVRFIVISTSLVNKKVGTN